MALKAPKRKREEPKKRSFLDRVTMSLRTVAWLSVAAIIGSVLWAGAYSVAKPPGTLTMVERRMAGHSVTQDWKPLAEISPHLIRAVIAAEDTRFCLHGGIDFDAIDKAVSEAENGRRLRGASTISQQTAKNVFFWNGGGWLRKGGEAWMTMVIETLWPKQRIMEVYLNVAEWGDGVFGAEAAAQKRFGKSVKHLTAREAALLAAVLPNPHKWRVDPPGPYVRGRASTLRARMLQVQRDGLDKCVL